VSGRRLSKNVWLWLSSRILPHSQSAASSQQPALQARARPEGEPSKDTRLLQASQRTAGVL
jgi:hypothetical protein